MKAATTIAPSGAPPPSEFRMPSLGADMQFGTVVGWRVAPGDTVAKGDVIVEVETEKGVFEVEAGIGGVVDELVVAKGTRVPVGTVLARLRAAGGAVPPGAPAVTSPEAAAPAAIPSPPATTPAPTAPAAVPPPPAAAPAPAAPAAVPAPAAPVPAPAPVPATPRRTRIRTSPLARRIAEAAGIDISTIAGTGPGGAITKEDVEHAMAAAPAATALPAPPVPLAPPVPPVPPVPTRTAADAMRQAVAAAVSRSKREIPHYYLGTDIDMSAALDWLEETNAQRPITQRILPAALLLKAVALALLEYPSLNGWWTEGAFRAGGGVHLGVAISLRGGGLIAPAIHDVDRLSPVALMAALGDLVQRARGGGLRGSEMTDATITVSNLGDEGVQLLFGVIYPPQVALVGFGRISERPWASGELLGVRPVVTATLSADHRATDGHYGARFLAELARRLQAPEAL